MSKDNAIFRALEIKSHLINSFKAPIDKMIFYLKEGNMVNFVEMFEKLKIDVNAKDEQNNTLLNIAVQSNFYEATKYLLDARADVNLQNVLFFYNLDNA